MMKLKRGLVRKVKTKWWEHPVYVFDEELLKIRKRELREEMAVATDAVTSKYCAIHKQLCSGELCVHYNSGGIHYPSIDWNWEGRIVEPSCKLWKNK